MKLVYALTVATCLLACAASAQPAPAGDHLCVPAAGRSAARLPPSDEGPRRADLVRFRQDLLDATRRKDVAAVLAAVHPEARVSFDGAGGPAAFKSYHIDNPDEDFWADFAAVLRMGGRFRTPDDFDTPYTFANWPDGADGFECLAVIGTNVRLREQPTTQSRVLAVLNYDLVQRVLDNTPTQGWAQVTTVGGHTGFVASRYLRSPIDHRALLEFRDGRWWLMAYISGD